MKLTSLLSVALAGILQVANTSAQCTENGSDEFLLSLNSNSGNFRTRDCDWLKGRTNIDIICDRTKTHTDNGITYLPAKDVCLVTCGTCPSEKPSGVPSSLPSSMPSVCEDRPGDFFFRPQINNPTVPNLKDCAWLATRDKKKMICTQNTDSFTDPNTGTVYPPAKDLCFGTCDTCLTDAPSSTPTDAPSSTPTDAPSSTPTDALSLTPSVLPSASPTSSPTSDPSSAPTAAPTPKSAKTKSPKTPKGSKSPKESKSPKRRNLLI